MCVKFGRFLYLLIAITVSSVLSAQCILSNYKIPDNSTVSIPIIISGATETLVSDNICNIRIDFNHESVNQLNLNLVSPAGQRLNLLGPSDITSRSTFPATKFNLSFVQCSQTPVPEPGYNARWNNFQTFIGATIAGSYYPTQNGNMNGCLEDFNTGPINGVWRLEIQDFAKFDEGTINCITIEFCKSKNLTLSSCDTRSGLFTQSTLNGCSYDQINVAQLISYPTGRPSPALFDQMYVLLSGSEILEYYSSDSIGKLEEGNYTLCPFSIVKGQSNILPAKGTKLQSGNFANDFARLGICGGATGSCLSISIKPPSLITNLGIQEVCKGQSFEFRGKSYTKGIYTDVLVPALTPNTCDQLFTFEVKEIEIKPDLLLSDPQLSCVKKNLTITGNVDYMGGAITYQFFSTNNQLIPSNGASAIVDRVGVYKVVTSAKGCKDSSEVVIVYDGNTPRVSLDVPIINCTNPSVTIVPTSTIPIASVVYSRGIALGNNVSLNTGGKLTATVTHTDGCVLLVDTIVSVDTIRTKPVLNASSLAFTCNRQSVNISIPNSNLFGTDLQFYRNGISVSGLGFQTQTNPLNNDTISMKVVGKLAANGCIDSTSIDLIDTTYIPKQRVYIECDGNNTSYIKIELDRPGQGRFWTEPQGAGIDITSLTNIIKLGGTYSFSYTADESGCRSVDTSFTIDINELVPEFEVRDTIVSCANLEAILKISKVIPGATYSWIGPFEFVSSDAEPRVRDIGLYKGRVTLPSGCFALDTAKLELDPTIVGTDVVPDIDVDCSLDTVKLVPMDQMNYGFNWLPTISSKIERIVNDTVFTVSPGVYRVEISRKSDGCLIRREIFVGDERDIPEIEVNVVNPSCDPSITSSISLQTSVTDLAKIKTSIWTGPNGFTSNELSITNIEPGNYSNKITTQKGCTITTDTFVLANIAQPVITSDDQFVITCDNNYIVQVSASSNNPTTDKYQWTKNAIVVSDQPSFMASDAGLYRLTVTSANNCTSIKQIQVVFDTSTTNILTVKSDSIECKKPEALLTFENSKGKRVTSWTYQGIDLGIPSDTIRVNQAGNYTVQSIDNRGCISRRTVQVKDVTDSVRYTNEVELIGCQDGRITLKNLTPYVTLTWSKGGAIVAKDTASIKSSDSAWYTVITESPKGCIVTDSILLGKDVSTPIILSKTGDSLITCLIPKVKVSFKFDRPFKDILWSGSSIVDTITNGDSLLIGKNGIYNIRVTGQNNCTTDTTFSIDIDTARTQFTLQSDTLTCSKPFSFLRVNSSRPLTIFDWVGPSFASKEDLVRVNNPGLYTLKASSANGCQTTQTIKVEEIKVIPKLTLPKSLLLPCNADSLKLEAISNEPLELFRWVGFGKLLGSGPNINVKEAGVVKLAVVSQAGCQAEDSLQVVKDTLVTIATPIGNNISCNPDSSSIRANITTAYEQLEWIQPNGLSLNNIPNFKSTQSGTYELIITRRPTCIDTFRLVITADTIKPTLVGSQLDQLICDQRSIRLQGEAQHFRKDKLVYKWSTITGNITTSTDSLLIKVDKPATYTFRAIDTVNKCSEIVSIAISEDQSTLTSFDLTTKAPTCLGGKDGSVTLSNIVGGKGPYMLNSNNGTGIFMDSILSGLTSGNFVFTLKDTFGCRIFKSVNIAQGFAFTVALPRDTLVTLGTPLEVFYMTNLSKSNISRVIWRQNGDNQIIDSLSYNLSTDQPIVLTIILRDINNCEAYDTMLIEISDEVIMTWPNVIRLSSFDMDNQSFKLPSHPAIQTIDEFTLFDRWGNIQYQVLNLPPEDNQLTISSDLNVQDGVYLVRVAATLKNGRKWSRTRDLLILK